LCVILLIWACNGAPMRSQRPVSGSARNVVQSDRAAMDAIAADGVLAAAPPDGSPESESANDPSRLAEIPASRSFLPALAQSFFMIVFAELGDKTFFIAAIGSLRHPRFQVFTAAAGALILMTVLSTALGWVAGLFSRTITHWLSTGLFLFFGIRLLKSAYDMSPNSTEHKELDEVERDLEKAAASNAAATNGNNGTSTTAGGSAGSGADNPDVELGLIASKRDNDVVTARPRTTAAAAAGISPASNSSSSPNTTTSSSSSPSSSSSLATSSSSLSCWQSLQQSTRGVLSPIFVQYFVLTFVAEWGDRSQVTTVTMAATWDPVGVTFGALFGHLVCTGLAVLGGRALATRISERTVTLLGGVTFLICALWSLAHGVPSH